MAGRVLQTIKRETPLAITLSCGERNEDELRQWRQAGADRYYLRFRNFGQNAVEKDPSFGENSPHRLDILPRIRAMGYETGSGILVGIPGQTWSSLVEDLLWFQRLDLDMIGCGPFVPREALPSGRECRNPGAGSFKETAAEYRPDDL